MMVLLPLEGRAIGCLFGGGVRRVGGPGLWVVGGVGVEGLSDPPALRFNPFLDLGVFVDGDAGSDEDGGGDNEAYKTIVSQQYTFIVIKGKVDWPR